ncbi:aldo/keto reductase [Jatrophihabitans sp.]|uniref:aldo/keto reductase n=1 Tax=Jatrophihabitans sp. TaxID=1932789 RepID=UPI0030C6FCBD|nr:aldo/keto reductase [Jatrophihabitans sp.]
MAVSKVAIGPQGLNVSALGLGAMVLSGTYGSPDLAQSETAFKRAVELGVTLIDTADLYGDGANESFLAPLVAPVRDDIVLATKCGLTRSPTGSPVPNGRPEHVAKAIDGSLGRLGVDHVDLYYLHRVDPAVPIEDTIGAMSQLVAAGKVGSLGVCAVTAEQLERANSVFPITAVQSEWSLAERTFETEVLSTARALGVGIVAFFPLGRGFLAGAFDADVAFSNDDRSGDSRFAPQNLPHNLVVLEGLRAMATGLGLTIAQLSLAWLKAQGSDVIPIPGLERIEYIEESVAALAVDLGAAELAELDALFHQGAIRGGRQDPGRPPADK